MTPVLKVEKVQADSFFNPVSLLFCNLRSIIPLLNGLNWNGASLNIQIANRGEIAFLIKQPFTSMKDANLVSVLLVYLDSRTGSVFRFKVVDILALKFSTINFHAIS